MNNLDKFNKSRQEQRKIEARMRKVLELELPADVKSGMEPIVQTELLRKTIQTVRFYGKHWDDSTDSALVRGKKDAQEMPEISDADYYERLKRNSMEELNRRGEGVSLSSELGKMSQLLGFVTQRVTSQESAKLS